MDTPPHGTGYETYWNTDQRSPRSPVGWSGVSWVIISVVALAIILQHNLPRAEPAAAPADPEQSIEMVIVTVQSKLLVGLAEMGQLEEAKRQAEALNTGPLPQRLRFIVLIGDVAGAHVAAGYLAELEQLIAQEKASGRLDAISTEQREVLDALRTLYAVDDEADPANVAALTEHQRDRLVDELGWFGELALVPRDVAESRERENVIASSRTVMLVLVPITLMAILLGLAGVVAWIIFIVLIRHGNIRSAMIEPGRAHHGIYAETFTVWLLVFMGLQLLGGLVAVAVPVGPLLIGFVAFFLSLVALGWPVWRGVPWRDVRHDIGLTWGRRPLLEPLTGGLGYLLGLPMLVVGAGITVTLVALSRQLGEPGGPLDPITGPAHPIVDMVTGADVWAIVQLYLVAAVAAPIVEETVFRGVLYRHQRDSTRKWGIGASVVVSASINGFVFAAIHPQGLLAVPALMSLAYAFTLVREWRGTIIPSIIVHAISNGLIITLLLSMVAAASST